MKQFPSENRLPEGMRDDGESIHMPNGHPIPVEDMRRKYRSLPHMKEVAPGIFDDGAENLVRVGV